jgi:FRG domain
MAKLKKKYVAASVRRRFAATDGVELEPTERDSADFLTSINGANFSDLQPKTAPARLHRNKSRATEEICLSSWSDFEPEIQRLRKLRKEREIQKQRRFHDLLFRGMGSDIWGLETTLERSYPLERYTKEITFLQYYKKIAASKPAVETLTGRKWEEVPDFRKFATLLKKNKLRWLDRFLAGKPGIYEYLVYLRHHGYPSPLLDWTASPYVAALFAFDSVSPGVERVAIYACLEDSSRALAGDYHFFVVGRYLRSDPRHYAQQSDYSMCVSVQDGDYLFCPHGQLTEVDGVDLFKITLPVAERRAALMDLDLMNINPFSVYNSEDSLIRTIARRECFFRDYD